MTFFTPIDLRYVDPRPEQVTAETNAAALRTVEAHLGDASGPVLAALGLRVTS